MENSSLPPPDGARSTESGFKQESFDTKFNITMIKKEFVTDSNTENDAVNSNRIKIECNYVKCERDDEHHGDCNNNNDAYDIYTDTAYSDYICSPGKNDGGVGNNKDNHYAYEGDHDNNNDIDNDTGVDKKIECKVCKKRFNETRYLKTHNTRMHGQKKLLVCEKLQKTNDKTRIAEVYDCIVCGKSYKTKHLFDIHIRSHTGEKPFACDGCEMRFIRMSSRNNHVKKHSLKERYNCKLCTAKFNLECALINHLKIHNKDSFYSCKLCKKSFPLNDSLIKHMVSQHKEKSFQCLVCSKSFKREEFLSKHMRVSHTTVRAFKCPKCERSFTVQRSLDIHIAEHEEVKTYQCTFCEKSFIKSWFLTVHLRSHTGEKPYKCDLCEKMFARKDTLTKHIRRHTGEKPYKCTACPISFARADLLRNHSRTHTGDNPICSVCNKSFLIQMHLVEHMKTHTGEKPHRCEICGKGFGYNASFYQHKKLCKPNSVHIT